MESWNERIEDVQSRAKEEEEVRRSEREKTATDEGGHVWTVFPLLLGGHPKSVLPERDAVDHEPVAKRDLLHKDVCIEGEEVAKRRKKRKPKEGEEKPKVSCQRLCR